MSTSKVLAIIVLSATPALAAARCLAIDGDTLVCDRQKIRLTNVYAAELSEAGGAAAKKRLQTIIASGPVTIVPHGTDRYGRTLAEVFVNGRRIEQADIGPRAGRGSAWLADRHHFYRRAHVQKSPAQKERPAVR